MKASLSICTGKDGRILLHCQAGCSVESIVSALGLKLGDLPDGVFNRLADNWRPLFAVAEIAGGVWPQRAASAFAKVTTKDDAEAHESLETIGLSRRHASNPPAGEKEAEAMLL